MKHYTWLILLVGWVVSSCSSTTSITELSEVQGNWQLQSITPNQGTTVTIPNPANYTARFGSDGSLGVRADCNLCGGGYETDGNALEMGLLACTLAFCGEGSFSTEYTSAISSASSFTRKGEELVLAGGQGTLRFLVSP